MYVVKSNICFGSIFSHTIVVNLLKSIEFWDGEEKYNGKSMSKYTNIDNNIFEKIDDDCHVVLISKV